MPIEFASPAALDRSIQGHLGAQLRGLYREVPGESLPEGLAALVLRLEEALQARGDAHLVEFRAGLLAAAPNLRAFAISLVNNGDRADDLVQDTIMRAWAKRDSFRPGTNLNAWLFTILRNGFYSEFRKRRREEEDPDGSYAAGLVAPPDQDDKLEMQDLKSALAQVAPDQREALWLVAVEGLSYEQAAEICGTAVGTVKSRVNRARNRLAELLGYTADDVGRRQLHP